MADCKHLVNGSVEVITHDTVSHVSCVLSATDIQTTAGDELQIRHQTPRKVGTIHCYCHLQTTHSVHPYYFLQCTRRD